MKEFKMFRGANFTGLLGEKFRFCALDDEGQSNGITLSGEVKKIYRSRGHTAVDLYLPALECIRTYRADRIYFHGHSRGA